MSELWAQFDLNLYPVTFSYTNPTPVNCQASILQTIDGQPYLLSLHENRAGISYSTGQPSPPNGQGATEWVSDITSSGPAGGYPFYTT
jgi:hypothetical protein